MKLLELESFLRTIFAKAESYLAGILSQCHLVCTLEQKNKLNECYDCYFEQNFIELAMQPQIQIEGEYNFYTPRYNEACDDYYNTNNLQSNTTIVPFVIFLSNVGQNSLNDDNFIHKWVNFVPNLHEIMTNLSASYEQYEIFVTQDKFFESALCCTLENNVLFDSSRIMQIILQNPFFLDLRYVMELYLFNVHLQFLWSQGYNYEHSYLALYCDSIQKNKVIRFSNSVLLPRDLHVSICASIVFIFHAFVEKREVRLPGCIAEKIKMME